MQACVCVKELAAMFSHEADVCVGHYRNRSIYFIYPGRTGWSAPSGLTRKHIRGNHQTWFVCMARQSLHLTWDSLMLYADFAWSLSRFLELYFNFLVNQRHFKGVRARVWVWLVNSEHSQPPLKRGSVQLCVISHLKKIYFESQLQWTGCKSH